MRRRSIADAPACSHLVLEGCGVAIIGRFQLKTFSVAVVVVDYSRLLNPRIKFVPRRATAFPIRFCLLQTLVSALAGCGILASKLVVILVTF